MAEPRGHEILVIAGMAQQEHAGAVHQIGVGTDVEIEIAAHAAARENANGAVHCFGHAGGAFHGFPGAFEELAMLGVHDRGFLGREAEELGVEMGKPVQRSGKGDIVAMMQKAGAFAGGDQLILGHLPDRGAPIAQVVPERVNRGRARQTRGHADDGDISLAHLRGQYSNRHPDFPFAPIHEG